MTYFMCFFIDNKVIFQSLFSLSLPLLMTSAIKKSHHCDICTVLNLAMLTIIHLKQCSPNILTSKLARASIQKPISPFDHSKFLIKFPLHLPYWRGKYVENVNNYYVC